MTWKKFQILWILFLSSLVLMNFIFLQSLSSLIIWVTANIIFYNLYITFSSPDQYSDQATIKYLYINSSLILTIVGQLMSIGYLYSTNNYFSYWNDDKYYFSLLINNLKDLDLSHPKFFTILITSTFSKIISLFFGKVIVINLTSIHWAIAPIIIVNSYKLACYYAKRNISVLYVYLGIFTQNVFYFANLHFYRDIYSLLFYSFGLLFMIKKKYIHAIVYAFLSSLIRTGNGVLLIGFIIGHFLLFSSINFQLVLKKWRYSIIFIGISIGIFSIPIIQEKILSIALYDVNKAANYQDTADLLEFMAVRKESLYSNEGMYKGGSMFNGNILKAAILPLSFPFIFPANYYLDYKFSENGAKGFNVYGIVMAICVFFLPLFLSLFILSIKYLLSSSDNSHRYLFIIFFTTLLMTAFISIVPRHYNYFIILFPSILAIPGKDYFSTNKILIICIAIAFFAFFTYRTIGHLL